MTSRALELRLGGRVINAVPSVHYCFPFAERVNDLCANQASRPDAIAVELSAATTADVRAWMVDLGVSPDRRTDLPCMLALVHPRLSDDTGATGAGSAFDLLYLTPSDSIIEAVRCAIELDVPVYGIDLQVAAAPERTATAVLEEPLVASERVEEYTRRNETYAARVREARTDAPRERAMASHLQFLLGHHKRVLMVCGLAHWAPLQELLLDARTPSAPVQSAADMAQRSLNRVVVHPLAALPYMDRFPAVVEAYQQNRRHPGLPDDGGPRSPIDATSVYARLIQAADAAYFAQPTKVPGSASDWEARADFESLLTHLCVVDQRRVPSAATVLTAAGGTMSREYRRQLAGVLLRYPWASPRDERFSALPVLVPGGPRSGARFVMVDARGRRGEEVKIGSWFGDQDPLDVEVPWDWVDERPEWLPPSDMVLNWPPIGRLVTALSLQAMERARAEAHLPRVEVFAGGLRDGLALKATLRAQAQGRDEWFVCDHGRQPRGSKRNQDQWDPVVWLFSLRRRPRAEWMVLAEELDEMLPLAQRPDEMRTVRRERGTVVVEQIGYGTRTWAFGRRASIRGGHSMYEWGGMLIYLPTHFTLEPTARFIESTQYRSVPIVAYQDPTSSSEQRLHAEHAVVQLFRDAYGMILDLPDWPTTLIRMAIPFAQEAVTVIAPDLFSIPNIVRNEAAQRGVIIRSVPHSAFPRERLSAISTWYGAQAVAGTLGTEFPEATERLFGEPASANSYLLPDHWLHYGGRARLAN